MIQAAIGSAAGESASTTAEPDLRQLADPEFFARWAATRNRMMQTTVGDPTHSEVKAAYEAVRVEYYRRIDDGMASA